MRYGLFLKQGVQWTLLVSLCGCLTDTGGLLVEVQHVIGPDTTCNFAVSNNILPNGYYDPTLASGYELFMVLRNNMEQRTDDAQLFGGTVNIRNRSNDIEVTGFEGCWYQFTGNVTRFGSLDNGAFVDCLTDYPNQSGSMPAHGEVDEGGLATGVYGVRVLTPAHLQQLFGSKFNGSALLPTGATTEHDLLGNPIQAYSFAASSPADANTRDPNWGQNYPTTYESQVVLQLRAVYMLQSGTVQKSNWFSYPVTICPGCARSQCGTLTERQCPTICPSDGSTCNPATKACTDSTPCTAFTAEMTGIQPVFVSTLATPLCGVAQGPNGYYTGPNCTTGIVGCQ